VVGPIERDPEPDGGAAVTGIEVAPEEDPLEGGDGVKFPGTAVVVGGTGGSGVGGAMVVTGFVGVGGIVLEGSEFVAVKVVVGLNLVLEGDFNGFFQVKVRYLVREGV
jgi:hypothetical protein